MFYMKSVGTPVESKVRADQTKLVRVAELDAGDVFQAGDGWHAAWRRPEFGVVRCECRAVARTYNLRLDYDREVAVLVGTSPVGEGCVVDGCADRFDIYGLVDDGRQWNRLCRAHLVPEIEGATGVVVLGLGL